MYEVKEYCQEQMEELEELMKRCELELLGYPEGTLRIIHNHITPQYYWKRNNKEKNIQYIKKSEKSLAEQLAQKDYTKKLLKLVKEKIHQLETCINCCDMEEIEKFYEKFSVDRQALITPFFLSEAEYIQQWKGRLQDKKRSTGSILV